MTDNKSFLKYVAETKSDYKYLLKFAVYEMTNEMIDCLEESLKKYELRSASSFRKTPIQESPLDFPNVKNTPVFICDLTLGYPASLDFLRTYICSEMEISPSQLVVYSENDPRQIETDLYVDRSSPEFKRKYKTKLGTEYEQTDGADLYGEKYNIKFLQELEQVRKSRDITIVENPLSMVITDDNGSLPTDYDTFNSSKNLPTESVGFFGRVKLPKMGRGK